ncbi:MAG TPA: winged helix-turn-helix transcriptional regulator [Methanocorpusculum sp.]|nr:winged helix-turn-helix transcriptional regulator [Methanocorpusculum sp.]HJJ53753.1 winged helix-turn-helix transcriptional regulator [Methanocorpusculum sp.]
MIIVVIGNAGSVGFNEMKRGLCGVSSKTLSVTLRELEQKEQVERKVLDTNSPTVRYCLTVLGCLIRMHINQKPLEEKKVEDFILEE